MSKLGQEMSSVDGSAEDLRARWFRRRTTVFLTVITAAAVRMVASGGPLTIVVPSSADHLVVTLRLTSVIEAVVDRGDPIGCRHPSGLRTNRSLPILPAWC